MNFINAYAVTSTAIIFVLAAIQLSKSEEKLTGLVKYTSQVILFLFFVGISSLAAHGLIIVVEAAR